jgi:hypothetical protein
MRCTSPAGPLRTCICPHFSVFGGTPSEQVLKLGLEGRELVDHDIPEDFVIQDVVAVSEHVPQTDDLVCVCNLARESGCSRWRRAIASPMISSSRSTMSWRARSFQKSSILLPRQNEAVSSIARRMSSSSLCGSCRIDESLGFVQFPSENAVADTGEAHQIHRPTKQSLQVVFEIEVPIEAAGDLGSREHDGHIDVAVRPEVLSQHSAKDV